MVLFFVDSLLLGEEEVGGVERGVAQPPAKWECIIPVWLLLREELGERPFYVSFLLPSW